MAAAAVDEGVFKVVRVCPRCARARPARKKLTGYKKSVKPKAKETALEKSDTQKTHLEAALTKALAEKTDLQAALVRAAMRDARGAGGKFGGAQRLTTSGWDP